MSTPPKMRITLVNVDTGRMRTVFLPPDRTVGEILSQMLAAGLIAPPPAGEEWALVLRRAGRRLGLARSLAAEGVISGDSLQFGRVPSPIQPARDAPARAGRLHLYVACPHNQMVELDCAPGDTIAGVIATLVDHLATHGGFTPDFEAWHQNNVSYYLQTAAGTTLAPAATPAEAGLGDGARLVLYPAPEYLRLRCVNLPDGRRIDVDALASLAAGDLARRLFDLGLRDALTADQEYVLRRAQDGRRLPAAQLLVDSGLRAGDVLEGGPQPTPDAGQPPQPARRIQLAITNLLQQSIGLAVNDGYTGEQVIVGLIRSGFLTPAQPGQEYLLRLESEQRRLRPEQTLRAAGVVDGALLQAGVATQQGGATGVIPLAAAPPPSGGAAQRAAPSKDGLTRAPGVRIMTGQLHRKDVEQEE